jgi:membrane-bound metal-dependent hydrolase YbcI (DUF457 family)
LANLADIDFIPGLFYGNPNRYHHGVTHSFGVALVVGFLLGIYFYFGQHQFWAPFGFATVVYFSHVFLDYLTIDPSRPAGVPIWWPISSKYFISPIAVFSDVRKDSSTTTFLQSLFVTHNGITVLREIIILGPLVVVVMFFKKLHRKINSKNFYD